MHRRGGAGEVVDPIDFDLEGVDHIMPQQFEPRMVAEVEDIALPTSEEVVETDHLVPVREESLAEMTAQKPGSAGDENTHREWGWIL